jgi:lysophospholipase L1-like esterase
MALIALLLGACSLRGDAPGAGVVLIGDSLAEEAAPYLQRELGDTKVLERFLGGTAPCDWLDTDLRARRSRIVVISFSGNSATPCMAGEGGQLRGEALVERYRADLTAMVDQVRATGAQVVLVGQPARGFVAAEGQGQREVDGVNAVYGELAEAGDVSFVDAGAAVEAPDGAFTRTLPCLPGEDECGPGGTNVVRSDDGVHFCPGAASHPCPRYSSGAFRFAGAIAAALDER